MSLEGLAPLSHPPTHRLRSTLLVLAVLLMVYLGYHGWQAYRHFSALRAHLARLTSLAVEKPASLGSLLVILQQDIASLRRDLSVPLAVAPHLGWLPVLGPTIQAGPMLFSAGQVLFDAIVTVWDVVQGPASEALSGDADPASVSAGISQTIITHTVQLEEVAARVRRATEQVSTIDTARLLPQVARPVRRIQALTPLLTAAFDGLVLLPKLMPQQGQQTFLLLAQNNDELRPTGGFISSIGVVTVTQGLPHLGAFQDSYDVESWDVPHDEPPEPLRKYMDLDLWVTRDGNWWPDFPTSAQAVAQLYERSQKRPVAGVLAVDMVAAVKLLDALTPLSLPDGRQLARGQVQDAFRQSWSLPAGSLVTSGIVVTATRPFSAIDLTLSYSQKSGQAWFDTVSLADIRQPGTNLVRNPSFEDDGNQDGLPDLWQMTGFAPEDRLVEDQTHTGLRSLHMVGQPESKKTAKQRIVLKGQANSAFRMSAESRAKNADTQGGSYALTVSFVYDDGREGTTVAGFPPLTHDWATSGSAEILGRWWDHRKDFMGLFIQAGQRKLLTQSSKIDWLGLLATGKQMLDQRHIQIYAGDPSVQAFLQRYGWSGTLAETPGDYLLVVDSNLGYNKVSANVTQSMDDRVTVDDTGQVHHQLTLRYHNRSKATVQACDKFMQYVPTYDALTQGCYWDYVRIYVPSDAQFESGAGGDEVFVISTESRRTVFATYLILQPNEQRELRIAYSLPASILQDGVYSLVVQKQAGTDTIPYDLHISAPRAVVIDSGGVPPEASKSSQVAFATNLESDRRWVLRVK